LSSLPGDRDRFVAEIGVAGNRRQSGAAGASRTSSRVCVGGERVHQAQIFGRFPRQLADRCRHVGLLVGLLAVNLGLPRSKNQLEVHCLIVARRVQNGFLRSLREGRELSANDIAAI
jgi:hypothetical protein